MPIGDDPGDVTARILRRSMINPLSSEAEAGQPMLEVDVEIECGGDGQVGGNGIPLTELFSQVAGFEPSDTWLDPTQPLTMYGTGLLTGGGGLGRVVSFVQGGTQASDQILDVWDTAVSPPADLENTAVGVGIPSTLRTSFRGRMRAEFDVEKL